MLVPAGAQASPLVVPQAAAPIVAAPHSAPAAPTRSEPPAPSQSGSGGGTTRTGSPQPSSGSNGPSQSPGGGPSPAGGSPQADLPPQLPTDARDGFYDPGCLDSCLAAYLLYYERWTGRISGDLLSPNFDPNLIDPLVRMQVEVKTLQAERHAQQEALGALVASGVLPDAITGADPATPPNSQPEPAYSGIPDGPCLSANFQTISRWIEGDSSEGFACF